MIKLHGSAYMGHERDGDGVYRTMPRKHDDLTFRCYADMLRHAATAFQHGRPTTPASVYLGRVSDRYGHQRHLAFDRVILPREEWERMVRLQSRYVAYLHYLREILPEWRQVEHVPWADNSVSVVEVDKWGNRREREITPPSGDACF